MISIEHVPNLLCRLVQFLHDLKKSLVVFDFLNAKILLRLHMYANNPFDIELHADQINIIHLHIK